MAKVPAGNDEQRERTARSDSEALLDRAETLKHLLAEIGRLRPLRDPISSLAHDLTPPQVHTLMWLGWDGPLPQHGIAHRVGCAQPTVTGVIDRLEKMGFVERERDADDRRVVRVRLSESGKNAYEQFNAVFTEKLVWVFSALPEEDSDHLIRIVEKLVERVRALETPPATPEDP